MDDKISKALKKGELMASIIFENKPQLEIPKSAAAYQLEEARKNNELVAIQNKLLAEIASKKWHERHWIVFTSLSILLGAILGVLGTLLVEYLKVRHQLGL